MNYPHVIEQLIEKFSKLPGIGKRSAERMVFWLLDQEREVAEHLASDIVQLKESLMFCHICNNFSENEKCMICADISRDNKVICVVENPKDLLAIEKTGSFKGHYHVLLGTISPAEGKGPEFLNIQKLLSRIEKGGVEEIVIATDPDNDGEMTALYITKQLKPYKVMVSRIGLGIPMGSAVEYSDASTLSLSMTNRREIL